VDPPPQFRLDGGDDAIPSVLETFDGMVDGVVGVLQRVVRALTPVAAMCVVRHGNPQTTVA
jgi:hypothetical protein